MLDYDALTGRLDADLFHFYQGKRVKCALLFHPCFGKEEMYFKWMQKAGIWTQYVHTYFCTNNQFYCPLSENIFTSFFGFDSHWEIFFLIIIIIIVMSCRQHGYHWPSLATSPYHSSLLTGLQCYIPHPHIAAVSMFKLVVLLLLGHMRGSIGDPAEPDTQDTAGYYF